MAHIGQGVYANSNTIFATVFKAKTIQIETTLSRK